MWNVVAPKGSDEALAAAYAAVRADYPDVGDRELSELIAERVPGARVGPLAEDEVDDDSAVLAVIDVEGEEVEVAEEPGPDVQLWFDDNDRAVLQVLCDMSTVFETIADVVAGILHVELEHARDEMAGGACETLRYIGGMTDAEKANWDKGSG